MYYHLKISAISTKDEGDNLISHHVTYLDLSHNDLGMRPMGIITKIFEAIPPSVIAINLSYNQLNKLSIIDVIRLMALIPLNVKALYLNHNTLNTVPIDNFIKILKALPPRLFYLGLGSNNLAANTSADLIRMVKAIPSTIGALGLSGNEFSDLSAEQLALVVANLHKNVEMLDLSNNYLATMGAEGLIKVLKALPLAINTLYLSENQFHTFSTNDLNLLFQSVPVSVHTFRFDLGLPHGINFTAASLITTAQLLPASISHLNLSVDFTTLNIDDLAKILNTIPSTVLSFDFRCSNICKIPAVNLSKLKSSLPCVETVYLNYEELAPIPLTQRTAIASIFPNAQEVILCNSVNEPLGDNDLFAHSRACRKLGFKAEIPSLKYHSAFFVKKYRIAYSTTAIPAEVLEFIDAISIHDESKENLNSLN